MNCRSNKLSVWWWRAPKLITWEDCEVHGISWFLHGRFPSNKLVQWCKMWQHFDTSLQVERPAFCVSAVEQLSSATSETGRVAKATFCTCRVTAFSGPLAPPSPKAFRKNPELLRGLCKWNLFLRMFMDFIWFYGTCCFCWGLIECNVCCLKASRSASNAVPATQEARSLDGADLFLDQATWNPCFFCLETIGNQWVFGFPETSQDKETSPQGVRKRCLKSLRDSSSRRQDINIATVKIAHQAPLEDKHTIKKRIPSGNLT